MFVNLILLYLPKVSNTFTEKAMAVSNAIVLQDIIDLRVASELPSHRLPTQGDVIRFFNFLKQNQEKKCDRSISKLSLEVAKSVYDLWKKMWPESLSPLLQTYESVKSKVIRDG